MAQNLMRCYGTQFFLGFKIPTEYKRKGVSRAEWCEAELQRAIEPIKQGRMGVREAVRNFGIPYSTLRHRLKSEGSKK